MLKVRVIVHEGPEKRLQAVYFFSARPTLLGRPLKASTVLDLTEEEVLKNRNEIEPLVRDGVLTVEEDGKLWLFPSLLSSLPWMPNGVPQTARDAEVMRPSMSPPQLPPVGSPPPPPPLVTAPVESSLPELPPVEPVREPAEDVVLKPVDPTPVEPAVEPAPEESSVDLPDLTDTTQDLPGLDADVVRMEDVRADAVDPTDPQEQFFKALRSQVNKRRPSKGGKKG